MKQQEAKEFAGVDQYVRGFRDGQVVSEETFKADKDLWEGQLGLARQVILLESAVLLLLVLAGWAMAWPWIAAKFQSFTGLIRSW